MNARDTRLAHLRTAHGVFFQRDINQPPHNEAISCELICFEDRGCAECSRLLDTWIQDDEADRKAALCES